MVHIPPVPWLAPRVLLRYRGDGARSAAGGLRQPRGASCLPRVAGGRPCPPGTIRLSPSRFRRPLFEARHAFWSAGLCRENVGWWPSRYCGWCAIGGLLPLSTTKAGGSAGTHGSRRARVQPGDRPGGRGPIPYLPSLLDGTNAQVILRDRRRRPPDRQWPVGHQARRPLRILQVPAPGANDPGRHGLRRRG